MIHVIHAHAPTYVKYREVWVGEGRKGGQRGKKDAREIMDVLSRCSYSFSLLSFFLRYREGIFVWPGWSSGCSHATDLNFAGWEVVLLFRFLKHISMYVNGGVFSLGHVNAYRVEYYGRGIICFYDTCDLKQLILILPVVNWNFICWCSHCGREAVIKAFK